jgi:type I restriction enzyme, R subunit
LRLVYADKLLAKDEWRKGFAVYENTITSLYEACKPEILGKPVVRSVAVFQYLRGVLDAIIQQKDIDAVALRVGELLDESLMVWKRFWIPIYPRAMIALSLLRNATTCST